MGRLLTVTATVPLTFYAFRSPYCKGKALIERLVKAIIISLSYVSRDVAQALVSVSISLKRTDRVGQIVGELLSSATGSPFSDIGGSRNGCAP